MEAVDKDPCIACQASPVKDPWKRLYEAKQLPNPAESAGILTPSHVDPQLEGPSLNYEHDIADALELADARLRHNETLFEILSFYCGRSIACRCLLLRLCGVLVVGIGFWVGSIRFL